MAQMTIRKADQAATPYTAESYLAFKGAADELDLGDVSMPAGLEAHTWKPRLVHPFPPYRTVDLGKEKMLGLPALSIFYSYAIGRGAGSAYRIAIAIDGSQTVRGFAVLKGPDFRFPFMGPHDIQLGPVWTADDQRGRGLAAKLCRLALRELNGSARTVWWLCKHHNDSSKAVARKLGLALEGPATRTPVFSLPAFHIYRLCHRPGETKEEQS